jgi:heterodisulfide reductase subunit B
LQVHNLVDFLRRKVGLEAIAARLKKPLAGLKVVPYYGCFMVKPRQVTGCDNPENPTSMDEILRALGAEVLDWDFKTECAGPASPRGRGMVELTGRIVQRRPSAEPTPSSWPASSASQPGPAAVQVGRTRRVPAPIVYLPAQVGRDRPAALGLNHHLVDPVALLEKKGLIG